MHSRFFREWCEKQKTSSEQQFCGQKRLVNERGPRRVTRLVKADKKVTVTWYSMQKSFSEHTMHQVDRLQQQKT